MVWKLTVKIKETKRRTEITLAPTRLLWSRSGRWRAREEEALPAEGFGNAVGGREKLRVSGLSERELRMP